TTSDSWSCSYDIYILNLGCICCLDYKRTGKFCCFSVSSPSDQCLGQVSYTIPEEMSRGSLVGNIAQDLGLETKRLASGKARIYTRDSDEYMELNRERGVLLVKQRIDREALCRQTTPYGGEPQMSGTMLIVITVLDVNDNAPVFTQPTYKATVTENSPKGTVVATVTASDADQGSNGKITYSITNTLDDIRKVFQVNEENGEINLLASDDGGLTDSCKLIVDVQDVNDNKPEIDIMSKSTVISEDAKLNTVVTMINIEDKDSGENGKVQCFINEHIPFTLKASTHNFFSLVTDINYFTIFLNALVDLCPWDSYYCKNTFFFLSFQ
uniref:Cadherin domain-containing protein n=1 Tax=Labrus bergylta TaxID=56723 RepID=A0A3Q3M5D5_9LABR